MLLFYFDSFYRYNYIDLAKIIQSTYSFQKHSGKAHFNQMTFAKVLLVIILDTFFRGVPEYSCRPYIHQRSYSGQ